MLYLLNIKDYVGSVNLIVVILQWKFYNPITMKNINEIFGF